MGLQIQVLNASTSREIDAAFGTFVRERPDALFVGPDPFFASRRMQLVLLAVRHAVPATFSSREFAEAGGLMSYGALRMPGVRSAAIPAASSRAPSPRTCRRAGEQVRAGHQPRDGQDARPRRAADTARPRRRGDRVNHCNPCTPFAAVHESGIGTTRTSGNIRLESEKLQSGHCSAPLN
jgi:hypothetical protein